MIKQKESALVLFSGGQDSTTCLYWAMNQFESVRTLCFTYGQRHSQEVEVAREIAEKAGVPFEVIDFSLMGQLAPNSLTDSSIDMDKEKPSDALPNTFVPGRNHIFLSMAAIRAQVFGIRHIVTGVSQTDFSGYPDCRDTFIRSLNVTLNLALEEQFIIHTPLMWIDKAQTWELADKLGVFDLVRYQTLTCYNGVMADGCGECPSCKLRKAGMDQYLATKQ